jgi:hypothetical protein
MGGWIRNQGINIVLIAGIWAFTGLLNGSNPWVSLDTPDSEFHASLAIFGHEVTDRSAIPAYYWTRIGYIAPAHLLTQVLGPLHGLEVYRLLLLAVIVASIFMALRHFAGHFTATILTIFVCANTVVLGYLGNPYPTATAMAAIFALIALGLAQGKWQAHLVAGGALGWLVMTSPFGTLLGIVAYLSVVLARARWTFQLLSLLKWAAAVTAGAATTFVALWLAGRWLFPSLNWIDTYLYWTFALNQADYIYEVWRWTYDSAMLVPALAGVIGVISIALKPRIPGIRIGGVLALTTPVFAVAFWLRFPNNYLEIPHYQAMLFPSSLMGIALIAASRIPQVQIRWWRGAIAAGLIGLNLLAGHLTPSISVQQTRLLAISTVVVFLIPVGKRWVATAVTVALTFASAQLLQNSRDNFGVSTNRLFANAYLPNEAKDMVSSAITAESWLLTKTQPGDRILTWVDADWASHEQDLLPLAAFQLWGANEAAHGPAPTLDELKTLGARKPLAIAMYGKTLGAILDFWNELPKEQRPSPPECIEVPWPQTRAAQVCVTHLHW